MHPIAQAIAEFTLRDTLHRGAILADEALSLACDAIGEDKWSAEMNSDPIIEACYNAKVAADRALLLALAKSRNTTPSMP